MEETTVYTTCCCGCNIKAVYFTEAEAAELGGDWGTPEWTTPEELRRERREREEQAAEQRKRAEERRRLADIRTRPAGSPPPWKDQ